jgi:glycerol-3-phosphate dehydrogenase (NAD(P)+)
VHSRRSLDKLPEGVEAASEYLKVDPDTRLLIVTVPSAVARDVARKLGDHLDGRHLVVHGIRGLAGAELETLTDILRQETPVRRLGALGGPALTEDLLAGKPSVLVAGSRFPEVNAALGEVLNGPNLRLYTTEDVRGVEWASALVGCLALAVGYAQGADLSVGIVAAFVSRAMAEAARLAQAAGAEERTLMGLAGYGDLLASVAQAERPEIVLGRAVARGTSIDEAVGKLGQNVEVLELAPRIATWADAHGVHAPIFRTLTSALSGKSSPHALVETLMTGPVLGRA